MNSHLTTRRLKHSTNFESVEHIRSSNVVEFEFELRHIPSQGHRKATCTLLTESYQLMAFRPLCIQTFAVVSRPTFLLLAEIQLAG